jgi:uncharacterized protein (TIGR03382 family)
MIQPLKIYEALTDAYGRFKVVLPKAPESTSSRNNPSLTGADAGTAAGPDAGVEFPLLDGMACSQTTSPAALGTIVLVALGLAVLGRRRTGG